MSEVTQEASVESNEVVSEESVPSLGELLNSVPEGESFSEGELSNESEEIHAESNEEVTEEEENVTNEEESKFFVNIDGQQVEVSKDELLSGYQRATAANQRFQEAARLKKEADEIQNLLQTDGFDAALKFAGDTPEFREKVESWLWNQLQRDQMDPKDREIEELRGKAKEAEELKRQQAEAEEQKIFAEHQAKAQEKYLQEFNNAFSSKGIEPEPKDIQEVASIMHEALTNNYDMPVEDAIDVYIERKNSEIENFLSKADIARLQKLIGKEKMNQLRKQDIQKLKNPTGRSTKPQEKQQPKSEKIAASDFWENFGR